MWFGLLCQQVDIYLPPTENSRAKNVITAKEDNIMTRIVGCILTALLIIGCNSSGPTEVRVGEQFQLKYDQSVKLNQAGLTITFKALGEDSRCPEGMACFWAGNARVVISVNGSDASLNSYVEPREIFLAGYKTQLLAVHPYPKANQRPRPEDYIITLVVTKE
jgi:hypothetical protein